MAKSVLRIVNPISLGSCVDLLPAFTGPRRASILSSRRLSSINHCRTRGGGIHGTSGVRSDGGASRSEMLRALSVGGPGKGLRSLVVSARAQRREGNSDGDSQLDVRRSSDVARGRPGRRDLVPGGDRSSALATFPSVWDVWTSPATSVRQMIDMMDRFDRLTDEAFFSPSRVLGNMMRDNLRGATRVPMEFRETDEAFLLRMDMPGLSKDEVKVQVEGNDTLLVSGEHELEEGPEEQNKDRISSAATYQSKILLPDSVKTDEIRADFKDGVLHVRIPKEKEPERKVVNVSIGD